MALATGTALAAAACTSDPAPAPSTSAPADPDAATAGTVAASEAELVARYDATLLAFPSLGALIAPIRDEHVAHRDAMQPAAASGSAASGSPGAIAVPGTQAEALVALIDAERQATQERAQACEAAAAIEFARVTALIAASEAGHVEFLRQQAS